MHLNLAHEHAASSKPTTAADEQTTAYCDELEEQLRISGFDHKDVDVESFPFTFPHCWWYNFSIHKTSAHVRMIIKSS